MDLFSVSSLNLSTNATWKKYLSCFDQFVQSETKVASWTDFVPLKNL